MVLKVGARETAAGVKNGEEPGVEVGTGRAVSVRGGGSWASGRVLSPVNHSVAPYLLVFWNFPNQRPVLTSDHLD
jgi:hypothetical protein